MNKTYFNKTGILIVIMAIFLGACSSQATPVAAPPDKATIQLSWFHGVEYAGFYTAIEKGYYKEENIDVVLNPGGPEINPIDEIQSGNAQFGITSGDSIIIAKTKQQNFVSVATIFRKNPLAITSLKKDNIQQPKDLVGKTIGVYSLDLSNFFDLPFLALLNRAGLGRDTMNYALIEDFQGANEIKAGNMEAMSGMFATDQQVMAKDAGDELNFIYYSDYGYDVYINTIFVKEEFLQNNSDLISRLVKATMKGYQYAIEHPEEVAGFALKYDPTLDLNYQQNVMKAQIPFINTGDAPIGSMNADVWATTQQILLDFNLISAPIELNTVYTNQYTSQ